MITLREKIRGCIAGSWVGSAMGAAVEGWLPQRIYVVDEAISGGVLLTQLLHLVTRFGNREADTVLAVNASSHESD